MNEDNRKPEFVLPNGLKVYKAVLVGGSFNGFTSYASHDTCIMGGETYRKGPDGKFYFTADLTHDEN